MALTNQKHLFSEHIFATSFQEEFKKHWDSQSDCKNTNLEVISKPFRVCRISNFIKEKKFLKNLINELKQLNYERQSLDLYQFSRSDDLSDAPSNHIQTLYKSFQTDLALWMERNTDIKLNTNITMSSACYLETDYLLCHDDNMIDRRIAFVLYLSEGWTEEHGGALDLFDTDERGSPRNVVKSLFPEYNSLVFFEVANNSYHQVAEVNKDECRLSINGWFHGPLNEDYKPSRSIPPEIFIEPSTAEAQLNLWISEHFLLPKIKAQIQEEGEKESYTFLKNFLKKPIYQQIAKDLKSKDIKWQMVGPADIRRYEIADEQTLPVTLKEFFDLFKSISFCELLKDYTALDLAPKKKTVKPKMTIELQRWSKGCYTLLYDRFMLKNTSNANSQTAQLDDDDVDIKSSTLASAEESIAKSSTSKYEVSNEDDTSDKSELHQELKRKSINTGENSSCTKKVKYSEIQIDINTEHPHKNKRDTDANKTLSEKELSDTSSNDERNSIDAHSNTEYVLDMIMQFHTADDDGAPKTEDTIDYVDADEEGGILIQVPQKDNHLCLVYRSLMIHRLQRYLNHHYKDYGYNLICTYYE